MPLFSRRSPVDSPETTPVTDGDQKMRDSLSDDGLLSAWFIQYRMEQEIERALRYERPLAILIARPDLLVGERLTRAARAAAAGAALDASRATDLVGWAEGGASILILMPETDADMARVAASRWRDLIWTRGRAASAPKWEIRLIHDTETLRSAQPLTARAGEWIEPAA